MGEYWKRRRFRWDFDSVRRKLYFRRDFWSWNLCVTKIRIFSSRLTTVLIMLVLKFIYDTGGFDKKKVFVIRNAEALLHKLKTMKCPALCFALISTGAIHTLQASPCLAKNNATSLVVRACFHNKEPIQIRSWHCPPLHGHGRPFSLKLENGVKVMHKQ